MQKPLTKCGLTVIALLSSYFLFAQNLVVNSSFSLGTTGWRPISSMEVFPETAYGGSDASNNATEIDGERSFSQNVCVMDNTTYIISLKTTRRPDPNTPATVGFTITVTGLSTFTTYVNQTITRTNTTFQYTPETFTFTIPSGSTDKYVMVAFNNYNNTATYGIILDNIEMHPQPDMSIAGINYTSLQSTLYYYYVANSPANVSDNWSFDAGSTPSTSASATPTVSWTTLGPKNVNVTISNGTCPVATLTAPLLITGVLPVHITNLAGNIVNDKAILRWTTTNEEKINHFVIEKSADGVHYESVALVFGENTPGSHTYNYTDAKYTSPAYYRVREVDINGSSSYSSVIILKKAVTGFAITLYPSYANTTLHYSVAAIQPAGAVLQVVNATGQTVITTKINLLQGENAQTLNVSQLAGGLYFLRLIISANGTSVMKQFCKL